MRWNYKTGQREGLKMPPNVFSLRNVTAYEQTPLWFRLLLTGLGRGRGYGLCRALAEQQVGAQRPGKAVVRNPHPRSLRFYFP